MNVHVSWILFKKNCLRVHVSGPVTCVKLTWTLAKLAKVRKTTNILRAYIFSIFSVLVRILESISLSRLRALLNVMFGHHGVVKIPMFRASQIWNLTCLFALWTRMIRMWIHPLFHVRYLVNLVISWVVHFCGQLLTTFWTVLVNATCIPAALTHIFVDDVFLYFSLLHPASPHTVVHLPCWLTKSVFNLTSPAMAGKSLLHVIIFERPLLPLFLGQIPTRSSALGTSPQLRLADWYSSGAKKLRYDPPDDPPIFRERTLKRKKPSPELWGELWGAQLH